MAFWKATNSYLYIPFLRIVDCFSEDLQKSNSIPSKISNLPKVPDENDATMYEFQPTFVYPHFELIRNRTFQT
jgi:hypothetical protein